MYQPTAAETKRFEKEWNEKYCRKGPMKVAAPVERREDEEVETDEVVVEVLDVVSTSIEGARTATRPSHDRGRSTSIAKAPFESFPSTSPPTLTRTRTSPVVSSSTSPLPLAPLSVPPHPSLPSVLTRKPLISHAVRNISCTRAITYFKRNFVLRFILEDEKQFLVQLNNHKETLVWQQVVTIAAPLALDIDERDMPDPAPYPRPRRRTPTLPLPHPLPPPLHLGHW
jgi:hypothetical protein